MRRLLLAWTLVAKAGALEEARAAEERYAYDEAVALYAEASPERAAWLRARSEGEYQPLAELEKARRDAAPDLERLAASADAYPEGLVRAEAWVFAAEAYARRDDPAKAYPLWRKAARDPHADPVVAHGAINAAVRAHLAAGQLDEAQADLGWLADEGAARAVTRMIRRRRLHYASMVLIGLVLAAVGATKRVRLARKDVGLVVGFAAFVAMAGAALALGYDGATAAPFLWLGGALVPLLLAARAWSGARPAVRAVACAASVIAAGFLVLEHTGHLDGLGL